MLENKKYNNLFKSTDALIAAFFVPVIIMIIIFVQRGIFPFGDRAFLRTDMYHQYAPFFSELQYKLQHSGSLLYSWDVGMGANFSAIYAYYLASPLNWFITLVPKAYVIEFMTYSVVLKIGLAGLTMALYLNGHSEKSKFTSALFAVFYAMSGYIAAYSWNIMWLDCVVLLPLIVLGLEKLVRKNQGILYALSLAVCIITNYYIAFMVCIFLVFYFIMLQIIDGRKSFKDFAAQCLHFGFYSIIAACIAAVVVLPELYALQTTASANNTFPKAVTQYFSIVEEFARHMINVTTEQELDHWPNIYCGVAILPLVVMYIFNRKIPLKEKIVYSFMIMLMLASFSMNVLSYIWHGFHYPNSLPSRQSFIYIFLILFTGFRAIENIEGLEVRDIGIAAVVSIAFCLYCQHAVDDDAFTPLVYYISIGFIGAYSVMFYLYRTEKLDVNVIVFVLLALVAVESAVNMTVTSVTTISRPDYVDDNAKVAAVSGLIEDDTDFYRVEKAKRKTKDDGAWLNMHTVSFFSSTAPEGLSTLYRQLGCEASTNAYSITGSTPLVDALFAVKYSVNTGECREDGKTLVGTSGDIYLYRNRYALPLGYMIPGDLEDNWLLDRGNPVLAQNDLCAMLGTGNVLDQIDGFTEDNVYTATIPEDGLYYAFSENPKSEELKITVNTRESNEVVKNFEHLDRGYLMELGWCTKNSIVDIVSKDDSTVQAHIYKFNFDSLAQLTELLGSQPMKISLYTDTLIDAHVDADSRGVLLMSIPYDRGWKIVVDGQLQTAREMFGGLTGIDLASGSHTIQMNYVPDGFRTGALVSLGGLGALLVIVIIRIVMTVIRKRKEEDGAYSGEVNENAEESGCDPDNESDGSGSDSDSADISDQTEEGGEECDIVLLDKPDILNFPDRE